MSILVNSEDCQNCRCKANDCIGGDLVMHRVGVSQFHQEINHVFWFQAQQMPTSECLWYHFKDVYLFYDSASTWSGDSFTYVKLTNVQAGDTITVNGLTFTAHATTTNTALRQFKISGTDIQDSAELVTCLNAATFGVPNQTAASGSIGSIYYVRIQQWPGHSITASSSNATRIAISPLFSVQMVLDSTYYKATTPGTDRNALNLGMSPPAAFGPAKDVAYRRIESLVMQSGTDIVAYLRNPVTDRLERDLDLTTVSCCVSFQFIRTMVARRVIMAASALKWNQATSGAAGYTGCTSLDGSSSVTGAGNSSPWFFTGNWRSGGSQGATNVPVLGTISYKNDWQRVNDAAMPWSVTTLTPGAPVTDKDKWDTKLFELQKAKNVAGNPHFVYGLWIGDISAGHDVRDAVTNAEMIPFCGIDRKVITLSGVTAGQTITVNGIVFTAHATTTTVSLRQFRISGTDAQDATQLLACLQDATYGVGPAGLNASGFALAQILLGEPYYPTIGVILTLPPTITEIHYESCCGTIGTVTSLTET